MKAIVLLAFFAIQLNTAKALICNSALKPLLNIALTDVSDLDAKKTKQIIAIAAPRFGLTKAEALYHYQKGNLTITKLEENEVYAVEFEGILETLIMDEQG